MQSYILGADKTNSRSSSVGCICDITENHLDETNFNVLTGFMCMYVKSGSECEKQ